MPEHRGRGLGFADDAEGVIYLGSFSKTIASGLRVGWAVAPHGVREKLVLAAESAVLCPSNYAQLTVSEYLATQPWREQISTFRDLYRERRDALLDSMTSLFPSDITWTVPAGGFYSWITLPAGLDAKAMLPRAVAALVAYVPGTGFYVDGQGRQNLRLSYCYPDPDRIRDPLPHLLDKGSDARLLGNQGRIDIHDPRPRLCEDTGDTSQYLEA
jgi:DNA-binding transcriptional MocR family regulator